MLAIVIPYFKIKCFEATLQSLVNQTDKRFKVYIGDDASPEDPSSLLEKYRVKFDFVYCRFESNYGSTSLVKQWERCIAMIGVEEWVMILGDDDVLGENVVCEFSVNLNELEDVNVIRFASCKINEKGEEVSNVYQNPKKESSIDFLFRDKRNSLSEYVFKREQLITIGFKDFPLAWCSDILAVLEFSNFKVVHSINEATVFVRISDSSISGSQDNIKLKNLASEQFSKFIIFEKFQFFTKIQRLTMLYGYEVAMKKNRKLKTADWFFLFKFHVENFKTIYILKFLRRFVISRFNL